MRIRGGIDALGFAGLVGLSVAVPLWAWLGRASPGAPEFEPGLGWLSMPVAMVVRSPAWRGWERLCPDPPSALPAEPMLPATPLEAETPGLPRLSYRGTLEAAGKRRYWFEELASGHRMALSVGEEDPVSRLRLLKVEDGERATFQGEGLTVPLVVEWGRK